MSNRDKVLEKIGAGWATVPDLCAMTGWKPHTLRAFLSQTTNGHNEGVPVKLSLERKRENGVTSYRVEREES